MYIGAAAALRARRPIGLDAHAMESTMRSETGKRLVARAVARAAEADRRAALLCNRPRPPPLSRTDFEFLRAHGYFRGDLEGFRAGYTTLPMGVYCPPYNNPNTLSGH